MIGLGSFMIPHHNLGLWGLLPGLRFGFLNSNKFDVIAIDCVDRNTVVEISLSSLSAWLILIGLGSFMIPQHNLGL
jgi:hypothetical protein